MSNYDESELAKFDVLAAHWWDDQGDLRTLHQINPLRLQYIKDQLGLRNLTNISIIDIGCGGGILTESLAESGATVTGIDLNSSLIEVANLHKLEKNLTIEYLTIAAETIAEQRPARYDVVTCLEMLEHVPDPLAIIAACKKLLKPNGHIFFSTINRNPKAYLFAIIGAEYLLRLLPKNTHDYAKFIKPSELNVWAKKCGLHPNDVKGIHYNPLTKVFSLSNDISVNYILHAVSQ